MTATPYPDHDVLANRDTPSWDDQTRRVYDRRLGEVPPRRFFTPGEWRVLLALCDRVLPQPDRAEPVPIAPWIDAALEAGESSGTRFADMPSDPDAWRQGLAALESEARDRHGQGFASIPAEAQDRLLKAVDAGQVSETNWSGLPPQAFFRKLALKRIVQVYYAHPAAMSEIGFGGPASPRGYVRLEPNRADPWEARFGQWAAQ